MILHTGSEGFIGKEVNRFLKDDDFLRVDRVAKKGEIGGKYVSVDVTDPEKVAELSSYGADTIIHNAAIPDIGFCSRNPEVCYRTNFLGTLNMLEFARKNGVSNFVYISSGAVYTPYQSENDIITEEAFPDPSGTYSYTKYISEEAVKNYSEEFGFSASSIRITAPYGPEMTQRDTPAIHTLIFAERIARKQPIFMESGGDHTVNYTYVSDIAQMIVLAARKKLSRFEPFNAAYGKLYTIGDLGEICGELSPDTEIKIGSGTLSGSTSEEEIMKPLRFLQGLRKADKAEKLLGYSPEYDLRKGMEEMIRHEVEAMS